MHVLAGTIQALVPLPAKPLWNVPAVQADAVGAAAEQWIAETPAAKRNKLVQLALENAPQLVLGALLIRIFWPRVQRTLMIATGSAPPVYPPLGQRPDLRAPAATHRPTRAEVLERRRAAAEAAAAQGEVYQRADEADEAVDAEAPAPVRDHTQDGGGFPSAYDALDDEQIQEELEERPPTDGPQVVVASGWRPKGQ